jgi:transcriptional regulator with XRE-family HTH domain
MTLREWIDQQGITQREAAIRLAVHEVTLHRWLNGRAIPRRAQMAALAALGVSPVSFFPKAQEAA